MLSTELLMKLQKVWETNKKCIRLMRTVMLLFQRLRREEKTRRKLKWFKVSNKKLRRKHLLNKISQPSKVKTTHHQLKAFQNHKDHNKNPPNIKNLPLTNNNKNKNKTQVMTFKNHYLHVHLRAELINSSILFHTHHSTTLEEDYLRNIN